MPNEFFGRAITVAGLLTGQDVARALSGRSLGDAVLIPRVALTETKGVFLDDVVPDDLARHLGVPIVSRGGQRPRTRRRPARPAARAGVRERSRCGCRWSRSSDARTSGSPPSSTA